MRLSSGDGGGQGRATAAAAAAAGKGLREMAGRAARAAREAGTGMARVLALQRRPDEAEDL